MPPSDLFELVALAAHLQQLLLGAAAAGDVVEVDLVELLEAVDPLVHGLEVREHAAQPALVDVGHPDAGRLLGDRLLGLLLGADEHDRAALGDRLLDEGVGAVDVGQRLLQVDDVDAVALGHDEALHLRVPATGLVPEVHAALEQLAHGDDCHGCSPVCGAGTRVARARLRCVFSSLRPAGAGCPDVCARPDPAGAGTEDRRPRVVVCRRGQASRSADVRSQPPEGLLPITLVERGSGGQSRTAARRPSTASLLPPLSTARATDRPAAGSPRAGWRHADASPPPGPGPRCWAGHRRRVLLAVLLSLARPAGALGAPVDPVPVGVWPLQPRPAVVRAFDPPGTPWGAGHRGVDLAGTVGQAVGSALPGTGQLRRLRGGSRRRGRGPRRHPHDVRAGDRDRPRRQTVLRRRNRSARSGSRAPTASRAPACTGAGCEATPTSTHSCWSAAGRSCCCRSGGPCRRSRHPWRRLASRRGGRFTRGRLPSRRAPRTRRVPATPPGPVRAMRALLLS